MSNFTANNSSSFSNVFSITKLIFSSSFNSISIDEATSKLSGILSGIFKVRSLFFQTIDFSLKSVQSISVDKSGIGNLVLHVRQESKVDEHWRASTKHSVLG